jgi:hypothetical protein
MLNLREAAETVGTSKTSIFRAIKSGRLSATRDDQGGVQIDPAELARVYPPKPLRSELVRPLLPEQREPSEGTAPLRERNAALETEVRLLRQMLEDLKAERGDLKAERDRWAQQAERLALSAPAQQRRALWDWLRRFA